MLHYLKSLEDWCEEESWELSQLPQMCWCVLSDCFHTTLCLEESAACVAVAVIYLCVMCTGLKIPMETADKKWWQVRMLECRNCLVLMLVEKLVAISRVLRIQRDL